MAAAAIDVQETMLKRVARALGPDLVQEMAFVGGCTVGLMITDAVVHQEIRYTDDVDVIVHILPPRGWYELEEVLRQRGFKSSPEDDVLCRKRLRDDYSNDLIVDFMPDDEKILGFGNRWYTDAVTQAADHELSDGSIIRVVSPPHFLGTKLEAWRGRGNDDPLASRDVEDILNVVNGRPSLIKEVEHADEALRSYIANGIRDLLDHRDFDYVVQSAAGGNSNREAVLFRRLEMLSSLIRR